MPRTATPNTEWSRAMTEGIAVAIRDLRGDMSTQTLSDITDELGCRVTRSVIADLETGRRKYIPAHELVMLAAALGVTPAALLTWGSFPDGEVEVLPGRGVSAVDAANWYGGHPFPHYHVINETLPPVQAAVAALWSAVRERERVSAMLSQAIVNLHGGAETVLGALSAHLDAVNHRVRQLTANTERNAA